MAETEIIKARLAGDSTERELTVLFPELLRPLTPKEYQGLYASIAKYGVRHKVVLDDWNGIIDGANRLRIAAKLGLSVDYEARSGLKEKEKEELALSLNLDRRHLTSEEREQARAERKEREVQGRQEGKSTRQIAEEEGVSHQQVVRDLGGAGVTSVTPAPPPPKVHGKDGKEYPAQRATKEEVAERRKSVWEAHEDGKTVWEIAEEEGISERQVKADLQAVRGQQAEAVSTATTEPEPLSAPTEEAVVPEHEPGLSPTPLDIAKEAWRRMDQAQRTEFTHWIYSPEANS
ncbi:MAG TPA: hypothetical protein VEL76_00730 [Gemmataceae bacterium]|nr:hypothetical protein [Gemmataceae bacterium]